MRTRSEHVEPFACVSWAMFGKGVGTGGDGGAGTLHTSGIAVAEPPPFVDAGNIAHLSHAHPAHLFVL
jgi:hypothetical protein